MTIWIIEPREPLIVRDGRPFDRQPGVLAVSLPFPFPSTTAGAARTRAGSENGIFVSKDNLSALKRIQIRGPLLAELDENSHQQQLLVPAPGDALLLGEGNPLRLKQLVPLRLFEGAQMQEFRGEHKELAPVGLTPYEPEKPAKQPPAFWYWGRFKQWLLQPEQLDNRLFLREELGIPSLPQEQRVHIALERGMMVAQEGALFETRGLEFTTQTDHLAKTRRLALWLDVEQHKDHSIDPGLDCLGAERRLVMWQKSTCNVPGCPGELSERIAQARACRLILLTPAYFRDGYLPDPSSLEHAGVKPTLQAALVQRPQVISGWDMERGKIRPTRRLAPAGSVYFLKFEGLPDGDNIRKWIEQTWMHCLSEDDTANHDNQYIRDGFGLAVLGTWSGEPQEMGIKENKA